MVAVLRDVLAVLVHFAVEASKVLPQTIVAALLAFSANWVLQKRQWAREEERRREDIRREVQRQVILPAVRLQDCPGRGVCEKLGIYTHSMCHWSPRTNQTTGPCWAALIRAVSSQE